MYLAGCHVRLRTRRVGPGGPAVAAEGFVRPAEAQQDAAPAHVRVGVVRLDLDGLVVFRQRVRVPAQVREQAPHGRMRKRVGGIGRDGPFVPADRLVVSAEPLGGLAGDHVARRRVGIGPVCLLDRLAVQPCGRLHVAAELGPAPAEQPEHGQHGGHLPQAALYVDEHHPQHAVAVVPLGGRSVRIVVAHDVQQVRAVEQLGIPLERAHHAELVDHGVYVVDALDSPVVPEQVGRPEEGDDSPELAQVRRRNVQADRGVHELLRVEHALPDLAVELL